MVTECLRETARWALYARNPFGVPRVHHHFSNPPAATQRNGCASRSGLRPATPRHLGDRSCQDPKEHATSTHQSTFESPNNIRQAPLPNLNITRMRISSKLRPAGSGPTCPASPHPAKCDLGRSTHPSLEGSSQTGEGSIGRIHRPRHRPQHPGQGVPRFPT